MNDQKLLKIGIIGTVFTAICCFTPALVLLLAALGLSVFVPGLDLVLPLLGVSLVIVVVALIKRHKRLSQPATQL